MNTKQANKKKSTKTTPLRKTVSTEAEKQIFTPQRFSVRGLRKHTGIQTSRTPRVIF